MHEFRVYLVETLRATELAYLVATAGFILALYWMNSPATARRGVLAGVLAAGDCAAAADVTDASARTNRTAILILSGIRLPGLRCRRL